MPGDIESFPSCPIKHIPLEVLLRITYWLPTPDLCNMRLTCHAIEVMLHSSFADEFFSRKQFMISPFSLQTLIDISQSRMSGHLRRLQFGTDLMVPSPGLEQIPRAAQIYADYTELLTTGLHRDLLAKSIRNLENLEDIVIRDFNSSRRSRDREQWRSYGSTTVCHEPGLEMVMAHPNHRTDKPHQHFPAQLFNSLLDALGVAGARPQGIEIMTRYRSNLSDFAFALNISLRPSVAHVLNSLQKLHLSVDCSFTRPYQAPFDPASIKMENQGRCLPWFLTHTPNLKNLRINEVGRFNEGLEGFLMWLAAPVPSDSTAHGELPVPIALPKLEELSLGHMHVEDNLVLELVKKFSLSLKSLELWRMCLVWSRPTPAPADDADDAGENTYNWKRFLARLSNIEEGLDLRHIKVGFMAEETHEQDTLSRPAGYRQVSFKAGSHIEAERAYTGPDWKNFLQEVIPTVTSLDRGAHRASLAPTELDDNEDQNADDDQDVDDHDDGGDE